MEALRKKNLKRPRQCKGEEQDVYLVKRVKVVGPTGPHAIPSPRQPPAVVPIQNSVFNLPRELQIITDDKKDPKTLLRERKRCLQLFFKSLVGRKIIPTVMPELDEDWPLNEDMDPDLAAAWAPIMRERAPFFPYVIGRNDFWKMMIGGHDK